MKKKNKSLIWSIMKVSLFLIFVTGYQKNETEHKGIGNVTDIDGNIYNTVTIGTQVWMMQNLKMTRYRNGDPIPNVTDPTQWYNLTTRAYCNYDNDPANSAT